MWSLFNWTESCFTSDRGVAEDSAHDGRDRRVHAQQRHDRRSEEHTSELQSHRDLHSFPTRRSSDLGLRSVPDVPLSRLSTLATSGRPRIRLRTLRCGRFSIGPKVASPPIVALLRIQRTMDGTVVFMLSNATIGDRKSTRLNSSHTEIYTLSLHDALPISGSAAFPTCRCLGFQHWRHLAGLAFGYAR